MNKTLLATKVGANCPDRKSLRNTTCSTQATFISNLSCINYFACLMVLPLNDAKSYRIEERSLTATQTPLFLATQIPPLLGLI